MDNIEKIKRYLKRLSENESLESVRADFVKEFKDVDSSEIIQAEQQLIKEGMPIMEVQKLCDVHSALFHGMITEEHTQESPKEKADRIKSERLSATKKLIDIKGHPLSTFTRENEALEELIKKCRQALDNNNVTEELLYKLNEIAIHYAKKGDLLYPHLKVKYEISGPSDVMWTTDDDIRDEVKALIKQKNHNDEWNKEFDNVLTRIEEMIYKESNILFPNCALNFTTNEWHVIYEYLKDYDECFGIESMVWEEAEKISKAKDINSRFLGEEIVMAGGHINVEQLTAMLNTIPLEITFVDENNINRYFNEGEKVFKRPGMAIDREVFTCHPPKIEQQVRKIIEEFRNNTLDKVPIWMNKNGRDMLVTYMAVRNKQGEYLGTMELVQDMEFAKEHYKA